MMMTLMDHHLIIPRAPSVDEFQDNRSMTYLVCYDYAKPTETQSVGFWPHLWSITLIDIQMNDTGNCHVMPCSNL